VLIFSRFNCIAISSGVSNSKFMSEMNRDGPERVYCIPFVLASVQILHWQQGLGIVVAPPEPNTISFIILSISNSRLNIYSCSFHHVLSEDDEDETKNIF